MRNINITAKRITNQIQLFCISCQNFLKRLNNYICKKYNCRKIQECGLVSGLLSPAQTIISVHVFVECRRNHVAFAQNQIEGYHHHYPDPEIQIFKVED